MPWERTFGSWRIRVEHDARPHFSGPKQVHGDRIVPARLVGSGEPEGDGILIDSQGGRGAVRTADCMPVAVLTEQAALVLHVSRKSLLAGLLDHVAQVIDVRDIARVWVGPHICEEHFTFEWEGDEIAMFGYRFPAAVVREDVTRISLTSALSSYLRQWGVATDAVMADDASCTYESASLPSYKRWLEQGKVGTLDHLVTVVERVLE